MPVILDHVSDSGSLSKENEYFGENSGRKFNCGIQCIDDRSIECWKDSQRICLVMRETPFQVPTSRCSVKCQLATPSMRGTSFCRGAPVRRYLCGSFFVPLRTLPGPRSHPSPPFFSHSFILSRHISIFPGPSLSPTLDVYTTNHTPSASSPTPPQQNPNPFPLLPPTTSAVSLVSSSPLFKLAFQNAISVSLTSLLTASLSRNS